MEQRGQCDTLRSHGVNGLFSDTAGPHGIMETIVTLEVMPWSGCLEQRPDKVKRIKWVFIKVLQKICLG